MTAFQNYSGGSELITGSVRWWKENPRLTLFLFPCSLAAMASTPTFNDMLCALMSGDNNVRCVAEEFFTSQLETSCVDTTRMLLETLASTEADPVLRSFAGILLRRSMEKVTSLTTPEIVGHLRTTMVQMWASEGDKTILRRLAHAMVSIKLIPI